MASMRLHTIDWRERRAASASLPAPKACATRTLLPTLKEPSAAMTKNITWTEAPTPATAAMLSWATIQVSTTINIVSRKLSPITGQASVKTRLLADRRGLDVLPPAGDGSAGSFCIQITRLEQ